MSTTQGSGEIITDSLILSLDFANIKCWQSSSVTSSNLINPDLFRFQNSIGISYISSSLGGVNFNASNSNISGSLINGISGSFYSIEWIFQPTSLQNFNQVIYARPSQEPAGVWSGFTFHSTGLGQCYCGTTNVDNTGRFSPTDIPSSTLVNNQTVALSFTFNNGSANFYKNGNLIASKILVVSNSIFNVVSIGYFGTDTQISNFYQLRAYNKPLSTNEVKYNYNIMKRRFNLP